MTSEEKPQIKSNEEIIPETNQASPNPQPSNIKLVPGHALIIEFIIDVDSKDLFEIELNRFDIYYGLHLSDIIKQDFLKQIEQASPSFIKRIKFNFSFLLSQTFTPVLSISVDQELHFYHVDFKLQVAPNPIGLTQLVFVDPNDVYDNAVQELVDRLTPVETSIIDESFGQTEWVFKHDGIWMRKTWIDRKGNTNFQEGQSWIWNELRVREILDYTEEEKYTIIFNGKEFNNITLPDLIKTITPGCCQNTSYKAKFGPLFLRFCNQLIKDDKIKRWKCVNSMGFIDKWQMPDDFKISVNPGIQTRIRNNLDRIVSLEINNNKAKQYFMDQYNATNVEYRDCFFAWGCASWALFSLLPYTRLMPWMGLWAHVPQTGKTTMAVSITSKWWDHLGTDDMGKRLEYLAPSITESQAKEYLAAAPLPIVFDDCGGLNLPIIGLLKSKATGIASWMIKNQNSTLRLSQVYKSSEIYTFNDIPEFLNDGAMLERGVIYPIRKKFAPAKAKNYNKILASIPDGYIGAYIYNQTKTMTINRLKEIYDKIPDWSNAPDDRANTIYKMYGLGKYFAKQLFDIELNIDDLPGVILETRQIGCEEIFDAIKEQCVYGEYESHLITINKQEDQTFKPERKWIDAPIYMHNLQTKDNKPRVGYLYDNGNKIDLNRYLKRDDLTLSKIAQILGTRWAIEYNPAGNITHDQVAKKRIWIGKENIIYTPPKIPSNWKIIISKMNEIFQINQVFSVDDVLEPLKSSDGVTMEDIRSILARGVDNGYLMIQDVSHYLFAKKFGSNIDEKTLDQRSENNSPKPQDERATTSLSPQ